MKKYIDFSFREPDYLEKTSLGIAFVSLCLVTPFGVYSLFQSRYLLSLFAFTTTIICIHYIWSCRRGQFNRRVIELGIVPLVIVGMVLIFYQVGVIAAYWCFPAVLSLYFLLSERHAWIANIIFIAIVTPVAWDVLVDPVAIRFAAVLLGTSLYAAVAIRVINNQQNLLNEQVITDSMTGLYNRSLLKVSLEHAVDQNHHAGLENSLIMLDLDNFKSINDDFGHNVGDAVLKSVSDYMKEYFRSSDMIFRIGGEEFLVLLHNTDEADSLAIAEKIRLGIEQLPLITGRPVTVSVGVSSLKSGMNWKTWMKQCDKKLYLAKSSGRNQVAG